MIVINAQSYERMKNKIVSNKFLYNAIKIMYKVLPLVIFLAYPLLVAYLIFNWDTRYIRVIFVPIGVYIAITIMRIIVNRPRPYEKEGISTLFPKSTKGKSFPSRHCGSAFIIAFAFWYISIGLGIPCMIIATIISLLRPVAGVHYISDILGAVAISSLFGILFFFIF